ncbi:DUF3566 domain-containing protein [Planosporangium mesophilum]|uniref:DUF3566 domain-containing protein n=1 Tax=Planosporangium mesophilum TaxID=689768 RepID=A0A8J3X2V3_9ACTN|nr:DUF3566 domain-containing protein [Planosporangium mesophilum]NJC82214.1 DUF3566 domain-containing protein [Planosporangium mesophilum]GII22263.1 hypothetical protein Pme01_18600 [Planosporangium mesophilum]
MPETQAKSGKAGPATKPAEADSESPDHDSTGEDEATGVVVGRATVPGEKSEGDSDSQGSTKPTATGSASVPKFTRAPGMAPPPDAIQPSSDDEDDASEEGEGADSTLVAAGAPAVARATVRGAASVTRPGLATQPIKTGGRVGGPGSSGPGGRVGAAIRSARTTVAAAASRGPRRARLYLKRVDPWSVMKFSFAVSFVLFIVGVVATAVLYMALDAMGVVGSVNKALSEMVGATGGDSKNTFKITAKGIIVGSGLLGLVNVVLFTALATLSAFIYNVCSDLVGGIELTLAEKE